MSKTLGRTPLGIEINRLDSISTGVRQRQKPPSRLGQIIDIRRREEAEVYEVLLRWVTPKNKAGTYSDWLPINEPSESIAHRYGSPQDLKRKSYYCRVEYSGVTSKRGIATLIEDPFYDREDVAKWNEMNIQGAAFAPPGSGMI